MKNINWEPINIEEKEIENISWEPVSTEKNKLLSSGQGVSNNPLQKENEKWILDFAGQDWVEDKKRKGAIEYKEAWEKLNKWEMVPYLNAKTLIDDLAVYKSMKKIQNNEKLSTTEYNNLQDFLTDMAEIQIRGYTLGGQLVNAGAQGLSFIGEFATSLGVSSFLKKGAQETVELGVKKGIKSAVKKGIKKVASIGVKGLAMTATMPHRVADSYLQRKISDGISITDKGEAIFTESTEKPATTLLKSIGDVWIENSSEFAGEAIIKPIYTGIGKSARVFMPKAIREGIDAISRQVLKLPFTKAVSKFGYDGIIEELGEERLADLLRTAFDLDEKKGYSMEQFANAMFPSSEQLLVELGVIGMYGGVSHTSNYLINKLKSKGISETKINDIITQSSELEKNKIAQDYRAQENQIIKNLNIETIDKIRSLEQTEGSVQVEFNPQEIEQIKETGTYIKADNTYNVEDLKSIVNRYDFLTTSLDVPEIAEIIKKEEIDIEELKELAKNKDIEIQKPETLKEYLEKNITPSLAESLNIPELKVSKPRRLEARKIQNKNDLINDLKDKGIIEEDATIEDIQNIIPQIDDIFIDVQKGDEYRAQTELKEKSIEILDRFDIGSVADVQAIERELKKPTEIKKEKEKIELTEEEIEQNWKNVVEENYRIQEEEQNPSIIKSFKEGFKNFSNKGSEILADIFTPFETRLYKIDPRLKAKFKKFTFFSGKRLKEKMGRVENFLQKTKSMSKKDFYEMDLALKNRNIKVAEKLAKKYNFEKEYQDIKDLFHEIYLDAISVGIDMNEMENYFVRQVNPQKLDDYLEYLNNLSQKGKVDIENNIDSNEAKISAIFETLKREPNYPIMSTEQKTTYINSRLRGFGSDNLLMFKRPSSLKKNRKIAELTPEMNRFYKPFTESLISYVEGTSETIENRRLFGGEDVQIKKNRTAILRKKKRIMELTNPKLLESKKIKVRTELTQLRKELEKTSEEIEFDSIEKKIKNREQKLKDLSNEKWIQEKIDEISKEIAPYQAFINNYYKEAENNIDDSVGKLVRDMVENEVIYAKDERIVRKLIASRFNDKSIGAGWGLARDLGYLGTLNDVGNAVTQLGDLSLSAYKTGLFNTLMNLNTKNAEIKLEDLGIEKMAEEFRSSKGLTKLMEWAFKYSGLNLVDGFGKNIILNSELQKIRNQANKNSRELNDKLDLYFPEKKAEIIKDLKDGAITDDIQFLAYETLSQLQPISKDQLPITYFRGGFYKSAYMLKTYSVKLLDLTINDIFKNIGDVKNPKNVIKGLTNLVKLQTMMLLFGVPKDKLMDLLLGRDSENTDLFVNNLLVFQLLNKYNLTIARRKGIGEVAKNYIIPPTFDMLSTVSKDIYDGISKSKNIKDMRSISFIPIAGRVYYYRNKEKKKRGGR